MRIRSLAYRTDLFFPAFDGQTIDRGDYLVIRTPSNPTFYWGNFLLFADPPGPGDEQRWRALFASEIGSPPEVEHQAFGWDSPEGERGMLEPFVQAGFEASFDVVLTTSKPQPPPRPAESIRVRPLDSEEDWVEAVDMQVLCRDPGQHESGYRLFRVRQMERYRTMIAAGRGDWYAAFSGDRVVADLGIFHQDGIGRYQSVSTHPDFRRRGIASTLVYEAGRLALARYDIQTLVIVAESESSAAKVYQSVGFRPTERSAGLLWWPHARVAA